VAQLMATSPPVAFVDAAALVALTDADDRSHRAAVEAYQSLVRDDYRLFTTDGMVAIAFELVSGTMGVATARDWLANLGIAVLVTDANDWARGRELLLAGGPATLTDAVSLAAMERLGVQDAFAVDPRFLKALG